MSDLAIGVDARVAEQLHARGVRDKRVLEAMGKVRRETFVAERFCDLTYADKPLPIAAEHTISQLFIIAYVIGTLALEGGEKVLEIGTGSGYAAAVMVELTKHRQERAIGMIYRLETELASHDFEAELPPKFDRYIWISRTSATTLLLAGQIKSVPGTYPFSL